MVFRLNTQRSQFLFLYNQFQKKKERAREKQRQRNGDKEKETERVRENKRERILLWQVWTHFKGQRNFKEWSLNLLLSPKELKKLVLTSQRETLLDYFVCFKVGTINSISSPGSRSPSRPVPSIHPFWFFSPPPLIPKCSKDLEEGNTYWILRK